MRRVLGIVALICGTAMSQALGTGPAGDVPSFHDSPPAKGERLPGIMTQKQLIAAEFTAPAQKEAYKAAAKIPNVMHQLPCYCYCDRNHGHNSLHSCFESSHGANCGVCMGEALYAYKMFKKGWTPKMIREGIIRGEYKLMDLQNPEPVL